MSGERAAGVQAAFLEPEAVAISGSREPEITITRYGIEGCGDRAHIFSTVLWSGRIAPEEWRCGTCGLLLPARMEHFTTKGRCHDGVDACQIVRVSLPDSLARFFPAVKALRQKVFCYHCRHAHFIAANPPDSLKEPLTGKLECVLAEFSFLPPDLYGLVRTFLELSPGREWPLIDEL
ncbi:MAG: hypothetical protein HY520_03390, partial [Candidatus Aenigmarchaeota archaeon]|nr:hypothetical protein [Candidatus Aenigmarchaeota archaeon]